MKTIAFCNSTLAWGGGETWHLEASLYLLGQGYSIIMMAHEDGALYARAKAHEGPRFTLVPLSIGRLSFLNPFTVRKFAKFLSRHEVDVVLMNLPQDLKCMGLAAKKAGIGQIIYRRGSALPVRDSMLNRYLYGKVLTGLITNSQATKREVYRHNKHLIPEDRVVILPNGIDISAFDGRLAECAPLSLSFNVNPGGTPGGECRQSQNSALGVEGALAVGNQGLQRGGMARLRFEGGARPPRPLEEAKGVTDCSATIRPKPIILGNAGRLNRQKGQHFLLYLANALEAMDVEYRLVIAGSGERRQELEALAQRLGVSAKVVFTGFLEDTCPFWKSIDVFVLTSLWEGFGYVLLEAMLSAKPILAFGVSNIPELVKDGSNGFLFPLPVEVSQGRDNHGSNQGNGGQGNGQHGAAENEEGGSSQSSAQNSKEWSTEHRGGKNLKKATATQRPAGTLSASTGFSSGPDMTAMAEAVKRLAHDPALRKRMGEAGRAFADPAFDQKAVMERLMRYLEQGST